jgi:hypothetical protein
VGSGVSPCPAGEQDDLLRLRRLHDAADNVANQTVIRPIHALAALRREYKLLPDEDTKSFLFEVVVVRENFRD